MITLILQSLSGPGPFPGVIDLFGTAGALAEFRAALLASRGFVAYALPYYGLEGLPESLANVEFEYFVVKSVLFTLNNFVLLLNHLGRMEYQTFINLGT